MKMNLKCMILSMRNSKGYIWHDFIYVTIWKKQSQRDTKQGIELGRGGDYTGIWENVLYPDGGGDFPTIYTCQNLENLTLKVVNFSTGKLYFNFKMGKLA